MSKINTQILTEYDGEQQLSEAVVVQEGDMLASGGAIDKTCLVQTENGPQLALKVFNVGGSPMSADVNRIVATLPETGDPRYLYWVPMDETTRDGYAILQVFVWNEDTEEWNAGAAYPAYINVSGLLIEQSFDAATNTLTLTKNS